MKKIIAFCGSKKAGKSTATKVLRDQLGDRVIDLAIAGHLKTTCSKVFGLDIKYFTHQDYKEVELETVCHLTRDHILNIFNEFNINEYDENIHIRPHIGKLLYTPRQILQYIGTELLHGIDKLIHVKKIIDLIPEGKYGLISDLRFESEFEYFSNNKDIEFIKYYIKNDSAEHIAKLDNHPSEQELFKFNHLCDKIDNNSDLNSFIEKIKNISNNL